MPAMSGHRFGLPLVVRAIVGKSWGQAAQHASAPHSLFANIPGLQVVVPSGVTEAARLLLGAIHSHVPTVMIELKSLYDLREPIPRPLTPLPLGRARVVREGAHVTFVAISDMVGFAERVAKRLARSHIEAEVLDLRTVAPLDAEAIVASVAKTRRVAVFDIGWEPFGLAAEVARVVAGGPAFRLAAPLVSLARAFAQTPASCFLEAAHYPDEDDATARVRAMVTAR
jgi:pyruvate dehydrogenase E1 component beta subunit